MLELGHIERNPMGSRNVVMGDEFNISQNQAKKSWMNKKNQQNKLWACVGYFRFGMQYELGDVGTYKYCGLVLTVHKTRGN